MSQVSAIIAGIFGPGLCTFGLFIWADRWKLGALALNAFKGSFASIFLAAIVAATTSNFTDVYTREAVSQMILASFLGIIVADTWWLLALDILGARKMIAIDSIKPFLSIGFGAIILGQSISGLGVAGVIVTTTGIVLVNLDKSKEPTEGDNSAENDFEMKSTKSSSARDSNNTVEVLEMNENKLVSSVAITNESPETVLEPSASGEESSDIHISDVGTIKSASPKDSSPVPYLSQCGFKWNSVAAGYWYALGNVLCDLWAATITIKYHGKMSVVDVSLVRFGFGAIILSLVYGAQRLTSTHAKATAPMARKDWAAVCFGVIIVTGITPLLTTYTYFELPLAIAVTLNSISPLWSLPIARCFGEHIGVKSAVGACLATGGVVMLVAGT